MTTNRTDVTTAARRTTGGEPPQGRELLQADPAFPAEILEISNVPRSVWLAGALPSAPRVAIVGPRVTDAYGRWAASKLAREAVGAGLCVASGGAVGVDAAAHQAAMDAGGATLAVLGTGLGVRYPARNVALFQRIVVTGGGLLTEYPPATPPHAGQFPRRNELLVAVCSAVVVVQARQRSGALITARLARAMGRPVLAVPGAAGGSLSRGTHELLRTGAAVCEGVADVLEALGARREREQELRKREDITMVWKILGLIPLGVAVIAEAARLSVPRAQTALQRLEEAGAIWYRPEDGYARVPGRTPEI